ncbi:MAG: NUDIX domain-containing protein [Eubacterium sp.]|nr:NUDIX domain-containing protein [Eubacterium sp.]
MIQELENNEVFTPEYLNIPPKKGDFAAVFKNVERQILMDTAEDGSMILPDATLFSDFWFDPEDAEADQKASVLGGRLAYLFTISGTSYYTFIYMGDAAPDFSFTGMEFQPFNFDIRPVPKNVFFGAETSFQLSTWYHDNRHCGRCGGHMTIHPKMRCVRCTDCGYMVFPRILPTVIIAPVHDDKLLMIRYRGREEDGYAGTALIAGFVEIGETVEDAVRREVFEESGLKATNIRYYKSQPWGFGYNLIIGAFCDIEGSTEIDIQDTNEIAEAAWLTRDEIHKKYNGVSITNEMVALFKWGENFRDHLEV